MIIVIELVCELMQVAGPMNPTQESTGGIAERHSSVLLVKKNTALEAAYATWAEQYDEDLRAGGLTYPVAKAMLPRCKCCGYLVACADKHRQSKRRDTAWASVALGTMCLTKPLATCRARDAGGSRLRTIIVSMH